MNTLPHGTPCIGAPGSIARKQAETEDSLKGVLYAVQSVMDDLAFHVQTTRFRPSQNTVVKLSKLRDEFNAAKKLVFDADNHGQAPEFVPVAAQRNL